jgi:hypothetical protein
LNLAVARLWNRALAQDQGFAGLVEDHRAHEFILAHRRHD